MVKEKMHRLRGSPAGRDFWRWSKPCRGAIAEICILRLVLTACSLAIPLATRWLIDGASAGNAGQLARSAVLLIGTVLGMRVLSLRISRVSIRASAALQRSLRGTVLTQLMKKQYSGLSAYHSGELTSRILSDTQVVKNGILEIGPGIVSMAVSFFGAAAMLLRMDWHLLALLLAGGALGLIAMVLSEEPIKKRHEAVQEAEAKYHACLQETLENLLLVKASGTEGRMNRKVDTMQRQVMQAQLKKGYFSDAMHQGINLTFQLSWMLCLLWGGLGIYRGNFSYGMLAAMLQLVNLVQGPISGAAGMVGKIFTAVSSAERIRELLELPEEPNTVRAETGELLALRLRDVRFGYETGPVLQQVSCTIRAGDFAAITGISGEGKSTLFRLLLGVYQPDGGTMEVVLKRGQAERAVPIGPGTRNLFAYIPQGNSLFSGTLRENIAMFAENVPDERILEAARIACIEDFVQSLPEGLDTLLGERGIGLSEGQAQRIAIARALVTQAPVLLLDESTGALDSRTEARVLENLSRLPGKTCLLVTHRKAALDICDYCLHVENGVMTARDRESS